ncbi:transposase [Bradyrhizobium sp. 141]|nr:transposase [Bradyrhizobium sp. 141]
MDSNKCSAQVERFEVVETGRRRRWTDDEKLKIVLESLQSPRAVSSTARRYSFAPRADSVHGCRYRQTLARPSLHICAVAAQSLRSDGCSSAHSRRTSGLLPDVRSP